MIAGTRYRKLVAVLLFTLLFLIACTGGEEPEATETSVAQQPDFDYLVTTDESPVIEVSGSEFEVTTNNCGSRVSAIESFSRSREFTVAFDAEMSESLRSQLGGNVVVADAEIEAAVEVKLGVQVGSTESVRTERRIETPADSITTVTLRWEEIWQSGQASIMRSDGTIIGDVPFRVLTTLRLSQTGIQDIPCNELTAEGQALPATEISPDVTRTPMLMTSTPSSPLPTHTAASTPTPEASATPRATNTPAPLINEVHTVDAYRTALGSSYRTGIYVEADDRVSVSYLNGQWWIGQGTKCNGYGDSQTPTDAEGYLGRDGERVEALIGCSNPNICRPLVSAPWGSLLGAIGESEAFFHIGRQSEFVAQDSGILFLRVNYYNHNAVTGCPYGDGGEITVRVTVTER